MPSQRAVGYRQAWEYLDGKSTYAEFVEKTLIATRQLAKRQLTWLKAWDMHCLADFSLLMGMRYLRVLCGHADR